MPQSCRDLRGHGETTLSSPMPQPPTRPRRVVVTGGAGFIGSHLVDALVARGDDVVVLDDLSTGVRENLAEGVRLVQGDVADTEAIGEALENGADAVLHIAGQASIAHSFSQPER